MPTAVSLIRAAALSDRAEYAYAATAPTEARLIFLAGSCPLNLDGTTAGIGDYAAQAAKCVENMRIALREAGAGITDVISTRVLVASTLQADLVTAWEVVREAFGEHDAPSTLLGVTVLGYDDQLVEIEAVAAVVDGETARSRAGGGTSGEGIEPGIYEHFTGQRYEVFGTARHSETEEVLVSYRKLYDDYSCWMRPLGMFTEMAERDGYSGPRFRRIA